MKRTTRGAMNRQPGSAKSGRSENILPDALLLELDEATPIPL